MVGLNTRAAFKAQLYAKMRELRYIILDGCLVEGDFSKWSKNFLQLSWLQWELHPHQELPKSLILPKLIVLNLAKSDYITHLWAKDFELDMRIV